MKIRALISAFYILLSCCVGSKNRDSISFDSSITEISDAILFINMNLGHLSEVNYYLDSGSILRIDNVVVGILDESFLDVGNLKNRGYSETDHKLFKMILFLYKNGINACFKHRDLELLVFDYKPTEENEFEEIRYLVYSEKSGKDFANQISNYAYVLDHTENLYLIALN